MVRGGRQRGVFQSLLQDREDAFAARQAQDERACTSRLEACRAVAFSQAEQAEAGTIGLLRHRARSENCPHQVARLRTDLHRPVEEAAGRPFLRPQLLRAGQVCRLRGEGALSERARVDGDTLLLMEEFDSIGCQARIQQLTDQRVRRAVEVARKLDVRIGRDPPVRQPFRVFVARAR